MSATPTKASDDKAHFILAGAAKVFSEKGYHHASMRDIARETEMSLAGIYHYFASKEEILYNIQRFCFREVLDRLESRLEDVHEPRRRLEAFIYNHLDFFTQNVRAMKVLSHESDYLSGEYRDEIDDMKREYFRVVRSIVVQIRGNGDDDGENRRIVLSLFGMVNWIYTWYHPDRDGTPEQLAHTMIGLLFDSVLSPQNP